MSTKAPSRRASSTSSPRNARRPRASAELRLFQRFCAELRVEDRPFKLYPEQIEIITPYFDGVTETLVILSKKNGKSTLIAALILFHVLTTPDADCVVVAVSREQAGIILRQAAGFIRRNEGLSKRLKVLQREILSLEDSGRARVLASDEDTAEGVIPTLAIVDELHGAKSAGLYDSLRMGLDGRQGRMVTISIAGSAVDSPLGQKRDKAYEMPGFVRDAERRRSYVKSPDGEFVFLEWCLNPDDDPDDLDTVKLVNPAPWKTTARLGVLKGAVSAYAWKRLACGLWTEGLEPWLPPEEWDKLARPDMHLEAGEPVWLGVDVGTKRDTTAIALVARRGDTLFAAPPRIFVPPKGGTLSLELVELAIREIGRDHPIMLIAYDPDQFGRSAEILGNEGYPMLKYAQSPEAMTVATATLYQLIVSSKLLHDGDQALRAHVMAGVSKPTERGFRLVKERRGGRMIDALIALEMACHEAAKAVSPPPLVVLPAEVF